MATEQGTDRGCGEDMAQAKARDASAGTLRPTGAGLRARRQGPRGGFSAPRWEKRKDVGGLALTAALPGTEHRWGRREQPGG